ncbi:Pet127-domain-containing protein [Hypoxylon rubiginosum]|uniref:Pet127-domain-containing protein n=1 Tax=Hypoxylon rubiginosum TaxID=110542 RepID=A0ACB9Z282_9PEZI|nr:Pet127-domain-containing protein [Hypoxylon rubiginosum]
MLQLSSRSAHRIGTSYVCASCLAASHPSRLLALHPTSISSNQRRPLTITSTSRRPATSTQTSTPADDGSQSTEVPAKDATEKKRENKRKKQQIKKADSRSEDARQLQVLQGALQALKNVLASQNINVDQIGKSTNKVDQAGSGPTAKPKTKAKAKSKSGTKPTKADNPTEANNEVAPASQDTSGKGDSKKTSKRKHVDKINKATAHATPTSSATPKDIPVSSKSKAGRSRRSAPTRLAGRVRSKGDAGARQSTKELKSAALRESLRNLSLSDNGINSETTGPPTVSGEVRGDYNIFGQPFNIDPQVRVAWKKNDLAINTISTKGLQVDPIETDRIPVPSLSYGLDRVLFNPGVYCLQDPRSKVYNFDPYLSEIMPIQEFDFNALKQYVTSSKDTNLIRIAKEHGKKYTGSTSSMTSMLSHFHFLLSSWREINASMLSKLFTPDSVRFTEIMRGPAAVFLHWKDGTYAIDADKEFDTANILSMLGKSMEKLLTLTKEEYERYRHINSDQITEEERNAEEAFHYTSFGDFMMRSQLDAYDPRIPGTGMFDLKTRAVVSIRMDAKGFQKGLGYEIRQRFGQWESFEREYYDMIRAAFLKYSLQVRMGRMDGIFVAFHNTQRIFGFQYIPLEEMDLALHGTSNKTLGNKEYMLSLSLLNDVLDRAAKRFPEQSLRLHFETRTSVGAPFMYIFAKPVTNEDIEEVQSAGKASIEAFEKEMLGIVKDEADADSESVMENDDAADEDEDIEESSVAQVTSSLAAWKEVRQMVEDAVDDDELGVGAVREAIEDSLEQSGLLHARSSTEARGYVDALLSALTSENPSELAEPSLDTPIEEDAPADENDSISTSQERLELESEPSSDEQPVSGSKLESEQPQIDEGQEGSTEIIDAGDQPKIDEKDYSKSTAQSDTGSGQDGERAVTTESLRYQTREDDQSVNNAAPEESSITEARTTVLIGEKPSEDAHVKTSEVMEEEEGEEEDDEMDEMDDEVEAGRTKKDPNATSTMSPLKDLIVKMARRIDERAVSEEADSSLDNSSKLKEFERILGELIARSKNEQTALLEGEISPGPDVESRPQAEEETKSIELQLEEAGNAQESSPQSSSEASETSKEAAEPIEEEGDPNLLGMVLTIKNKVNDAYVPRPVNLKKSDKWTVEYNIEEITGKRAQTIYQQCRTRRRKVFEDTGERDSMWYKMFRGQLQERTQSGRKFRASETARAKWRPVHVVGHDGALKWTDVFGKQQQQQDPTTQEAELADDEHQDENTDHDDPGEEGDGKSNKES